MMRLHSVTLFVVIARLIDVNGFDIVDRQSWDARPPKYVVKIDRVVPFVVIHHSYLPPACPTTTKCKAAMRSMQAFHQNDRGWADIGYNFAVGGDGLVYEGRGFNVVGAHAPIYNGKSIGICLIGDWTEELPSAEMLDATHKLIAFAIDAGHLSANYTLIGHRQARLTECPGERLYSEITNWPHFGADVPVVVP